MICCGANDEAFVKVELHGIFRNKVKKREYTIVDILWKMLIIFPAKKKRKRLKY